MKLAHHDLEHSIGFSENTINVLTIENKQLFVKLLQSLLRQCLGEEGDFVLSENDKEIEINKICELIIDPFNLEINNKKLLNKVFAILKTEAVNENHYLETNKLKSALYSYFDSLLFDCDIPLSYQEDFDISLLFKLMNIKIECSAMTLLEKLMDYIAVSAELLNTSCFIFVNLKQFLTYNDLAEFYKFAGYIKVNILLLETCFSEHTHKAEKHYIIDNDLCEIY